MSEKYDNSISMDDEFTTISAAIYRESLGTHNVVLQREMLLAWGSFGIDEWYVFQFEFGGVFCLCFFSCL